MLFAWEYTLAAAFGGYLLGWGLIAVVGTLVDWLSDGEPGRVGRIALGVASVPFALSAIVLGAFGCLILLVLFGGIAGSILGN